MNNWAQQFIPAPATKWTIISGPMKGTVRLMNFPQFTVGRSAECEFVINDDPKCSRKHAQINSTGKSCEVISLNERNHVLVNGKAVERADLKDEDVLVFGSTEVQFQLTAVSANPALAIVHPSYPPASANGVPRRTRARKTAAPARKRWFVYAIVGAILFWLFTPSKSQKKDQQLRSEQQIIQSDIDAANKLREASENQALKKMELTVPASQAQENFVRGFRDYRKGQFERSVMSFQACLALSPEHVLCNRYMRLAQRKFDELIQYEVVLGRKYRDQNQFKACRAAFRNVMVMVKDPNSPIYQESKANYEACDSLAEGRF